MGKTRAKTPAAAAAAAASPEKSVEVLAPPVPELLAAPVRAPTYPYLLSLETLREIFGSDAATTTDATAAVPTTAHKLQMLQQALGAAHCDANARSAVWVDWCFDVLCFARSREINSDNLASGFVAANDSDSNSDVSDEKALLALTIADEIFQFAVSPLPDSDGSTTCQPSLAQCYDRFRTRIRDVSNSAPPVVDVTAEAESPVVGDDVSSDDPPLPAVAPLPPPLPPRPPVLSPREVAAFVAFMSATLFRHLAAYQFVHRHARPSVTRTLELSIETPFPAPALACATQELHEQTSSSHSDNHDTTDRDDTSSA